MNYHELTPSARSGYDGYMDPSAESAANKGPNPAPLSEAARSLLENEEKGGESDVAPTIAEQDQVAQLAKEAMKEKPNKPPRDYLVDLSQRILGMTDPGKIRSEFYLVEGWAHLAENGLPKEEKEKLKPVFQQVENIGQSLKRDPLGQRSGIASVAQKIKDYFEKEKLIERVDYFKPITSFEEFMIKIADFTTKDEFRPGGKFQLLETSEEIDKFGRKIVTEKAHPENFIQWTRDQLEFFHDFTPMGDINLFNEIAIPTASRAISLGEILYGATSETYSAHRVPKVDKVFVEADELEKIAKDDPKKFTFTPEKKTINGREVIVGGKYIVNHDDRPAEVFTLKQGLKTSPDGQYQSEGFYLLNSKGTEEYGTDLNKDSWNTEKDKRFDRAKDDVMWEAFLLTNFHNYSVRYQLKAMQNEAPLKEQMAEIYGVNMMTRNRNRLMRMLRMQSAEKADEVTMRLEKDAVSEDITQGSVGKAMQRSLAGYYHLAEASAAASGYNFDSKDINANPINAFVEVMRGKDKKTQTEIYGSDEFYKGLINETFNDEFDKEVAGIKELINRLNEQKIAGKINEKTKEFTDDSAGEALRDRKDYEKVQISEVAFLSGEELFSTLRTRCRLTEDQFNTVLAKLKSDYQNGYEADGKKHAPDSEKLKQVNTIGNRKAVLELLQGKKTVDVNATYMQDFINGKNGWKGLDVFAVKFYTEPFAKGEEGGFVDNANFWGNISNDLVAQDRVRKAMRHAVSQTEKLSDFESLYAEEFAFSLVYQTGISARNDMGGIGHDAWSKLQNTEFYRLRQTGGGNYPGNLDNLYGIHRLGLNFWEGIKIRGKDGKLDTTAYEMLTGLKNGRFDVNKDVGTFDFYGNAERQFFADHLGHVIDLFIDITQKHEFNFDKIVKVDQLGRVTIEHAEMQKLIDSTWKHMRYGFDNRAFLYDTTLYGWWYDEKIEYKEFDEQGNRLKPKDIKMGQVKRTPRFGFKTIRDLMFSEELQSLQMYNRSDVSGWKPSSDTYKMGRNVFAYLIKAQFEEHTKRSGTANIYTAGQISLIADALMSYTARLMKGEHGEAISLSGFFTPEEMYRIMVMAHAILWQLYAKEYGLETFGGFLAGIFQAMSLIMKEVGAGITLKS